MSCHPHVQTASLCLSFFCSLFLSYIRGSVCMGGTKPFQEWAWFTEVSVALPVFHPAICGKYSNQAITTCGYIVTYFMW